MNLIDFLSNMPMDHLVVSDSSGYRTVEDLLRFAEKYGVGMSGSRIALIQNKAVEAIEILIAADGSAESITLLPGDVSAENLAILIRQSNCNLIIGHVDQNVIESFPEVECLPSLSTRSSMKVSGTKVNKTIWQLVTSGTTGTPKIVAHTLEGLSKTVKRSNQGKQPGLWGLLYDHTRFAGIQVVLQSIFSGSTLFATDPNDLLSNRIAALVLNGCTHLSATPTLWRNILMSPSSDSLTLLQITLGGEISDDRILSTLKATYPVANITHIFASTEAGVGFSVKDGIKGFPTSYLESPPAGIALRICNGLLQVRNTEVTPIYVGTRDRFGDDGGWIETGDRVEIVNNRVYFLGRASGVINVGGNKVYPEEIEQLLISNPSIQFARVSGRSSSVIGAIVMADIIPTSPPKDVAQFRNEIKSFLKPKIPGFKIPAIINIVDNIGTTAAGKIKRGKSD